MRSCERLLVVEEAALPDQLILGELVLRDLCFGDRDVQHRLPEDATPSDRPHLGYGLEGLGGDGGHIEDRVRVALL